MRFFITALGVLSALQLGVHAQDAAAAAPAADAAAADPAAANPADAAATTTAAAAAGGDCADSCSSQTRGQFSTYGCTSADDAACLCANSDFLYSVRDCAQQTCNEAESEVHTFMAQNFCLGYNIEAVSSAAVSSTAAAESTAAATDAAATTAATEAAETTAAATTDAATTATDVALTSDTAAASSTAAETTEAAQETTPGATPAVASSSEAAESSATETAAATTSGTDGAAGADATSSSGDEEHEDVKEQHGPGLSSAAEIGIGVGIGAAVLAASVLGVCVFLKARRRKELRRRGQSVEITQPLPGVGPSFPPADNGSIREKNNYDLEIMSHRYEDMIPRQVPRNMV